MAKGKKKKKQKQLKRIKTPVFRVSFPSVFEPASFEGEQSDNYEITMLFDEDADLSELKKAAKKCAREKWGKKLPKKLHNPFRDGEEREDTEGYGSGVTFVKAISKRKPQIVDKQRNKLDSPEDFYAGCYAIATVSPFAFEVKGNKGISFGLGNILKVDDGEPFGFSSDPMEDFDDDFEEDDEFEDEDDEDTDLDDDEEDDDNDD